MEIWIWWTMLLTTFFLFIPQTYNKLTVGVHRSSLRRCQWKLRLWFELKNKTSTKCSVHLFVKRVWLNEWKLVEIIIKIIIKSVTLICKPMYLTSEICEQLWNEFDSPDDVRWGCCLRRYFCSKFASVWKEKYIFLGGLKCSLKLLLSAKSIYKTMWNMVYVCEVLVIAGCAMFASVWK